VVPVLSADAGLLVVTANNSDILKNKTFFMAFIPMNLCQPFKNWRILLEQCFTANISLAVATSAFRLERRC